MGTQTAICTIVAPFTGAWIEITFKVKFATGHGLSRPSRARGLKYKWVQDHPLNLRVAPFTGAWIEIDC